MYNENIKYHPRMLELRLALVYDSLYHAFGNKNSIEIIKGFCESLKIDYACIDLVLRNYSKVMKLSKFNRAEHNRQVIVMGESWGETKSYVGRVYLNGIKGIYSNYSDIGVDDNFLSSLDKYTAVLAEEYDINNVKNFLENFNSLINLFS